MSHLLLYDTISQYTIIMNYLIFSTAFSTKADGQDISVLSIFFLEIEVSIRLKKVWVSDVLLLDVSASCTISEYTKTRINKNTFIL